MPVPTRAPSPSFELARVRGQPRTSALKNSYCGKNDYALLLRCTGGLWPKVMLTPEGLCGDTIPWHRKIHMPRQCIMSSSLQPTWPRVKGRSDRVDQCKTYDPVTPSIFRPPGRTTDPKPTGLRGLHERPLTGWYGYRRRFPNPSDTNGCPNNSWSKGRLEGGLQPSGVDTTPIAEVIRNILGFHYSLELVSPFDR